MEKFPVEAGDIVIGGCSLNHHKLNNGNSLLIHMDGSKMAVIDQKSARIIDDFKTELTSSKILQSTDDSRYVLVRDMSQTLAFCVIDLITRKTPRITVDWWKGEKPTYVVLGPPGCVLMMATHSITLANYTERDAIHHLKTIDLPELEIVEMVYSPGCIFVRSIAPYDPGLWMITLEPPTRVRLFEASRTARNLYASDPMEVTFLTPSVIACVIHNILYIYDLFAMKLIRHTAIPKGDKMVFSSDGKYLLTFGWYHNVLEIVPVLDAVNLFNNPGPEPVYKPMYEKNTVKIEFYDFRPNCDLLSLKLSPGHVWSVVSMEREKLVVKNTSPGFHYDIIFKHPFPHPVFESVKSDFSWARIMSNDTLETNLTWPGGIPLTDRKRVKEVSGEFSELLPLAIWIDNIDNDYSTTSFEEAKRRYLGRLVKAIAKGL